MQYTHQIQQDSKNGTFDVVKNFEEILYVCDVKRKKFGNSNVAVLPNKPSERCLKYIREHQLTCRADTDRFIHPYRKVLSDEIAERQVEWDQHYKEVESQVKSMMRSDEFEVVRFTHHDVFVEYSDVEMKVNRICNTTFLGDFVVGDVKIKENAPGSYTEIWGLKIPCSMKYSLKDYYMVCSNKCGYI